MCYFSSHVPLDRTGSVDSPSNYHEFIFLYLFWHLFLPLISVCKQSSLLWTLLCLLIHENYKAVQLTAKLLHRSKVPCSLLKIDIAKAFDTVNWQFLLDLLQHLGFSRRWVNWISIILSTANTKVILNGTPGIGEFAMQGDSVRGILYHRYFLC